MASRVVQGVMVASRLDEDATELAQDLEPSGIFFRIWEALLETAGRLRREYVDVVKERPPQDDPRIENLEASLAGVSEELQRADRRLGDGDNPAVSVSRRCA